MPNRIQIGVLIGTLLLIWAAPVHAANDDDKQPKSTTADAYFHKNGSVTISADGKDHLLSPLEYRRQAFWLLKGKQEVIVQWEDFAVFERQGSDSKRLFHDAGIRKLTLKTFAEGQQQSRTFDIAPPTLEELLTDRKAVVRQAAIDTLATMLQSENRSDRIGAMDTLHRARQVRFDRRQFLAPVRNSLNTDEPGELGRAIGVIGLVGGDASDLPQVARHVEHALPSIRAGLCSTMFQLDPSGKDPHISPAVIKLLNDPEQSVRTATFKSMWGCPSTPDIDARLIEMSRGVRRGGSSEADEVIYYALSTRPLVRVPVAERLIELIGTNPPFDGRAVWGISHHRVSDEARPAVIAALTRVADAASDEDTRQGALWGLNFHGNRPKKGSEKPSAPPTNRDKPRQLWQQLTQSTDTELRKTALAEVERKLKDEATAAEALQALLQTRWAKVDLTPLAHLIPLVQPYLASETDQTRGKALMALAAIGPAALDDAAMKKHLQDESSLVRQGAAIAQMLRDPQGDSPFTAKAILDLLNDRDMEVVQATVKGLWGFPTTPAAEEALIELSYVSKSGYDVIYYALSTRPLIRKPVAERLIDLVRLSERDRLRAIWGLSHHKVAEDARELVVAALIEVVDEKGDDYNRSNAIHGLGQLRGATALARLQRIVADERESEATRNQAQAMLAQRSADE